MKKKLLSVWLSIAMLTSGGIANIASAEEAANVIYVSATLGNDANSGTISAPLATIDAAKLKAREMSGAVTVEIMDGDYRLSSTVSFTADDSNVTYKAYEGAKPEIKGSVLIPASAAKKVAEAADETALAKMTENAREDAFVINLSDYGITQDMIVDPALANHQYGITGSYEFNNFFVDGNSFSVAQWPNNKDYAQFDRVNDETSIVYADDYGDKWAGETGWWVGLWIPYDYSYFKFAGVSVDAENNILDYTDEAISKYSKKSNGQYDYRSKRWKVYNLISEMDVPGEYYIDRDNLKLYFYPTSNFEGSKLELEVMSNKIIEIIDAENITFDGLTFTQTTGNAIYSTNVKNIDIRNCTFKDIGMSAVVYRGTIAADTGNKYTDENGNEAQFWQYQRKNGSYDCDVENNVFMNIGSGAISMTGAGDIDTLTPSNNYIRNNILYDISCKSAIYGITLGGCGVTFENNNIGKSMIGGVYMYGNNHTVQYNELYNLMAEASDGAAIYQGRADVFRGSKAQYNYLHDMVVDNYEIYDGLYNGQCGIYWDDAQSGMNANHNIFKNVSLAYNSNQAGDCVYSNNTAVDCTYAWKFEDNPHKYGVESNTVDTVANGFTLAQLAELIVYKDLYYDAYENLEAIVNGTNPKVFNKITYNLSVNSPYQYKNAAYNLSVIDFSTNREAETDDLTTIFVNPQNNDYRVKADSEYANLGVLNEDFDIDLIGMQTDFELNAETAAFEKLYPAKNANIDYQDEYNFIWSSALGANKYRITVATDEAFEEVVFEGETAQTGIKVSGLSDETIYYWKVEAENTSRELANTWQTVEGTTAFGVNYAMYQDSEAPEIPANLLSDGVLYNGRVLGYQNEWSSVNVDSTKKIREYTWKQDGGTYWKIYPISFQANSYTDAAFTYVPGKKYVLSAMVKDTSTDDNLVPIEFAAALRYKNTSGTDHQFAYSLDSQLGDDYRLRKVWSKYSTTIEVPEDYASGIGLMFGTRDNFAGSVDQHKYSIYDVYLGEEIAYDIDIQAERTKLLQGDSVNVSAKVLNQGGKTGYLDQDVEWLVVNADRTTVINGAEVVGNTLYIDETVPAGTYALVAMNDTLTKGIEIKVVDKLEDNIQENLTDNLIVGPADLNDLTHGNGQGAMSWQSGNYFRWTETAIEASKNYGAGPTALSLDKGDIKESLVAGESYVMSVRLKNALPEVKSSIDFGMSLAGSISKVVSFTLTSSEYQTYTASFTADNDSGSIYMGLDAQIDRTGYTSFGAVDMDISNGGSLYIAKEAEHDIEIDTSSTVLTQYNPITVSGKVLNQIGEEGNLDQNISWALLSTDRTEVISGSNVEYTEDGAIISIDKTVAAGNYSLVAISDNLVKGIDVTVMNGFADTETPEMAANIVRNPATRNTFTPQNGAAGDLSGVYGDYNRWTEKAVEPSTNYGAGPTVLAINEDPTKTNTISEEIVNGESYVVSARLRNAAPEVKPSIDFAMSLRYNKKNAVQIPVTSTEFETYSAAFVADIDSSSIHIGLDAQVDRSAYTEADFGALDIDLSNGGSLYIAKEQPYSMNITADNTILTPFEPINVSAEVLNQVGIKGNLNQDVDWYVVTADRTAIVEGAKIEKTETGVSISIDGVVPSGDYAVVAMSDAIVKGINITVLSNYADTQVEMAPNMIVDSDDINRFEHTNGTKVTRSYASGDYYAWTEEAAEANTYWGVGSTYLQLSDKYSDLTQTFEKGKRYVISVRLKNANPDAGETVEFAYGLSYLKEGTINVTSTEYQTYTSAFTASLNSPSLALGFDTKVDRSAYTELASVAMDISNGGSLYVAKEQAYSINITGKNEIGVGGISTISAELLNQIGTKGALPQDFKWLALNADRTAYADGLILVDNQDGTVTVSGVEEGTYTVLAMTEDNSIIKGYTVTVTEAVEEPVEKIASATFTKTGANVNFKATVENTDAEKVFFVIGEFNGKSLVQTVKSDVKLASDANCDLTLEGVTAGNTVRAFIWNNGTLFPIDNPEEFSLEYAVTE